MPVQERQKIFPFFFPRAAHCRGALEMPLRKPFPRDEERNFFLVERNNMDARLLSQRPGQHKIHLVLFQERPGFVIGCFHNADAHAGMPVPESSDQARQHDFTPAGCDADAEKAAFLPGRV